jgi:tRNA pseudouridine55 synthase
MSSRNFISGELLLIDKPMGWSSFDVVNKIRYSIRNYLKDHNESNEKIPKIKVGHAGTLDPLATGLLIICTGKFTKRIDEFMLQEKEYTGSIRFGASTPSYDSETPVDFHFETANLDENGIREAASHFLGAIQQIPPMYSAIKKDGKKLYELARKGETVELKPRDIYIKEFSLFDFKLPEVNFRIVCSKGTYIRSIAHDLGKAINNGAHLTSLRRTKIGDYKVEDALSVEEFINSL